MKDLRLAYWLVDRMDFDSDNRTVVSKEDWMVVKKAVDWAVKMDLKWGKHLVG